MLDIASRSGFSGARLATLDQALQRLYVDSGDLPGAQIQIWRRGALAHSALFPSMDLEQDKRMREDAIFRIYSMTKPITAVALLILVEEGKIRLGDEVSKFIPSWKDLKVLVGGDPGAVVTKAPTRPMRVIDLATHMSGLTYGWLSQSAVGAAYRSLKIDDRGTLGGLPAMIDQLSTIPLECSPGERWIYSVSTTVLGYLVETVSGMKFGDFLKSRIFEPLGMDDTGFFCLPEKLDRLTSCYQATELGAPLTLQDSASNSSFARRPNLENGGGGLVSTATDYIRFCRMLLGGGSLDGRQVLSRKAVKLYGTNFLPGNQSIAALGGFAEYTGTGMSIACATTINPGERSVHATPGDIFWSGAAATHFWVDPVEDLAVVFMTQVLNTPHFIPMQDILRALVYGAFAE